MCIEFIVIAQDLTKVLEYTANYGRYIIKMNFSAIMLFEILRNLYMSLRLTGGIFSIENIICNIFIFLQDNTKDVLNVIANYC